VQSSAIGAVEITAIPDALGVLGRLADLYRNAAPEEWQPYRELYPELFAGDDWRLPVAVYLVTSGGETALVDTGVGPPGLWGWQAESEGWLPAGLREAGLEPEDVDVVLLTHLHIDHLGWNADADAVPFFPRARYVVHPDAVAHAMSNPDRPQIQRCVVPLLDRFEDAVPGADVIPGVAVVELEGHYPGHVGARIRSNGEEALLLGDIAPHPALLDRVEWVFTYDEVAQTATRARLVEEVADSEIVVVCGHYPGSGIGHVRRRAGRVVWEEARRTAT
jgi:glyoxylase-like metal-dependent hydrolase (beta-lactamase superfamily II)